MESKEKQTRTAPEELAEQIRVVINRPPMNEGTVDFDNVFRSMKSRLRIFACLLAICVIVGACIPLLAYQFKKATEAVVSVVTLKYDAPVKVLRKGMDETEKGAWYMPENPEYAPVTDLSAPDGTALDLTQISSTPVLQKALESISLTKKISVEELRANISVNTILTEESDRIKEALMHLIDEKNSDIFEKYQKAEMRYSNNFLVSLRNGFGLTEVELQRLEDQVLSAYNDYLAETYGKTQTEETKEETSGKTWLTYSTPEAEGSRSLKHTIKLSAIGAIVGMILAFGLWFMAAFIPEFFNTRVRKNARKGADAA